MFFESQFYGTDYDHVTVNLQDKAPKEASIYFHMGQIYRRLNRTDLALMHFSQALDLKPSSADVNMIKSAIEKLRINNDFDDGV